MRIQQSLPLSEAIDSLGYAVVENAIGPTARAAVCAALAHFDPSPGKGGARNLLMRPEIAALCRSTAIAAPVCELLGVGAFAYKATLFDKTPTANWKVAWHQDLSIPVRGDARPPGWKGWSIKAGVLHAQPPAELLEQVLAVRVHLDDCDTANGALRVIPRSHREGRLDEAAVERWKAGDGAVRCDVKAGGLLLMRPLILHSSSAGDMPRHRRVVHLEFATVDLPAGLEWAEQITIAPATPYPLSPLAGRGLG
jgi:ectoine hydroxylase-related dioxygenase (phytanoyl-CoA dioxygenase family)